MINSKRLLRGLIVWGVVITISLMFGLTHIFGLLTYSRNYSPLLSNSSLAYIKDETYTYAAQVQLFFNGYPFSDPYIWEYRDSRAPFVGEFASILPIVFLSIITFSVENAFIITDFIFPPLLFLLIYFSLKRLNYKMETCLAAGVSVIVAPYLSVVIPHFYSGQLELTGPSLGNLLFTRTPHPQISSLYLFLLLFATVLMLGDPKKRLFYIWCLVLGVSLYSSPYISTPLLLASFFLLPWILKGLNTKKLLLGGVMFSFTSLFWFYTYILEKSVLSNVEFLSRYSFEKSFLFPIQLRYLFFSIIFLLFEKQALSKVIFFIILSSSLLIDLHQLIFNRNIQADHWISRIMAPVCTLIIILLLDRFFRITFINKRIMISSLVVVMLVIGAYKQITWIELHTKDLVLLPSTRKLLDQINEKTSRSDVIGTLEPRLNDEIRAITGRWVYIAPGDRSMISSHEDIIRVCNLISLIKDDLDEKNKTELINYILALERDSLEKKSLLTRELDKCRIEKKHLAGKFKLDYIVIQNEKGEYILKKIKL